MQTTRRSFLQSVAAAMSVTVLGVRSIHAAPAIPAINYDLFTGWNEYRYDLRHPWSHGGLVCATDRKILITHPGHWDGIGEARVPPVDRLWWEEFDSGGFVSMPDCPRLSHYDHSVMCGACMGRGRVGVAVKCVLCNGLESEWVDANDVLRDGCQKCENGWVGGVKCTDCRGSGWMVEGPVENVLGGKFSPGVLNRLRTLGNLDVKLLGDPQYRHRDGGVGGPVLAFRGDHGIKGFMVGVM